MDKNILTERCSEIDNLVWDSYIDNIGNCEPIPDGIVNIDKYLSSKYKILWVLKEPYDDFEVGVPAGGGWHFAKDFLNSPDFRVKMGRSRATWQPIIYTTYGILNDFLLWNEMPYIREKPEMMDIIHSVAVINIRKLPGGTRTIDFQTIAAAYNECKEVILKQIEIYNPDIIIGASTLSLLFDDLKITEKEIENFGSVQVVNKNNRLFINAYHPAQTTINRERYVNDIINSAKNWIKLHN